MRRNPSAALLAASIAIGVAAIVACHSIVPSPPDPQQKLVARGERIFFEETFEGNGRTCGTCHRAEDNFGLTPAFIATRCPMTIRSSLRSSIRSWLRTSRSRS